MPDKINTNRNKQKLFVYIVLTAVILAVFYQVKQFDFVTLDDNLYVTDNLRVQKGITFDGVRWALISTYDELWLPLTWLSLMLDYQLYGLNPGGYHLTNLILHILSALLLFGLLNRMTGSVWRSAFVAAVFALHPLRAESVAWVAERKDVLAAFFWMLTLNLYVYYTEKPDLKKYLLVVCSFVPALMSKSTVVTLPVIMILLDYWPLGRFQSQKGSGFSWQLKEKMPLFILSVFCSIITIYAHHGQSMKNWYYPLDSRIINAFMAFEIYLGKIFWPHPLAVCYHFFGGVPLWQAGAAVLLIIVISAFVILTMKRLPYLFVGWFWYAIAIGPVIGIIPVGNNAMADRYIYLPSVGITLMLAWGIPSLFRDGSTGKKILFPAGIAVVIILSVLTWRQCGYWKNSIELFSHSIQVIKNNALAHYNRGIAYGEKGNHRLAVGDYNEAIRLKPDYAEAFYSRGNSYGKIGWQPLAIEDYSEAIRLKPDYAEAYNNRGNAYAKLGRYQQAIGDYNQAIRLKPDLAEVYNNKGNVYVISGQYQQAVEEFNKAIHIKPDYAQAYNNLGLVYLSQGNKEFGCRYFKKACESGKCIILEEAKKKGYCR